MRPPAPEKCSITGCDTKHQALGLCKYHYFASSKYGINNDQIEALESSAVCAICGREASRIDHCHDTGIVRGRLCHACNVGLGLFGDSPDTLREAANYIERQHDKENMS